MKKAKVYWPLILLLAIIKFVLPLFLQSPGYELQRDEYLYYQQGQHLALGYLENPPLISYLGTISSWLGDHEAWIKIWPCFFGAATLVITCLITAELGGKLFAQFLAGISMMTGAYMRVHFLFQPNMLDIFFWTLAVYFIIRYINEKEENLLFCFTISLALGFWGKYSVLFIIAGMLLALLLSQHRKIFTVKKFYLAALLALLVILPNVWWQYQHNWPLLHHMEELQETQLKYMNPAEFITDQFMMLLATVLVWIAGLVWYLKNKQWRFLAYTYFFVILLLILGRGKNYYSLGIYPMLLAAGAVTWEQWTQKRKWIRYAFAILIIAFSCMILPMLLPVRKPEKLAAFYEKMGIRHKWEDQKNHPLPQDFADMLGWRELTEKAEKAFSTGLPVAVKDSTIIYCRNYGQAGSLKFYGFSSDFKNRVISDNGSFLLWIPDSLRFRHMLFIGSHLPDKDDEVFQHFESYTVMDSVTNPLSRQFGNKIILFENADEEANQLAGKGLKEMKKKFNR